MRMRKAVASGITGLLAMAALAACGDAPDSSAAPSGGDETTAAAASDFLPCMVSDAGGFDDKSFNQLSYEGLKQAAKELGVELQEGVESKSDERLRPEHREPGRPRTATSSSRSASRSPPRPRRPPRPTRTSTSSSSTTPTVRRRRLRRQGRRPNVKPILFDTAQAAFLGRLRGRRATRRPASSAPSAACSSRPSPSSWTASRGRRSTTTSRRARTSRSSAGTSPQNGSFTGGFEANETAKQHRSGHHRPGRRRASCRSVARSTRAPLQAIRTPARTSR